MLSRERVLPQMLSSRADRSPDVEFLREVGGRSFTLRMVDDEVRRWAQVFRQLGVSPQEPVLTMLPSRAESYFVWLGLGWLRAIEVPVSTQYRGYMLRHVMTNSGASVMVVAAGWLDVVLEVAKDCPTLRTVVLLDGEDCDVTAPFRVLHGAELLDQAALLRDGNGPAEHDIAAIFYTSGTTGASKGVMTPWAQLYATASGLVPERSFDENDVAYMPFPMNHAAGRAPFYAMLICGGMLVLRDGFSTAHFFEDMRKHGCTYAMMFAAMAQFLLDQPSQPDESDSSLTKVMMVPLIPDIEHFCRRFRVQAATLFNMTELSIPIMSTWNPENIRSCGRVRPGYQCRVVDEHDREMPPGEVGELVVRSDEPWTLMAGYWRDWEKTAAVWRNQWQHTGDAFRYDEAGNFYFVDRLKDVIRRRGENISSMELEEIVQQHPDVLECAAVGVPSKWQEEEVKISVVPRPESGLTARRLVEYLIPLLPRFMIPRYVEFRSELPKTPTGKVRKVELRELVAADVWDREASDLVLPKH